MKILLVDGDRTILDTLALTIMLHWPDAQALQAGRAGEALRLQDVEAPDLVILDVVLPDGDGCELIRRLRERSELPILVVSGRCGELDKVRGLEAGADDYVAKPLGALELLARIKALLRRTHAPVPLAPVPPFVSGGLRIDFAARSVQVDGATVHLSPIEYRLLYHLVHNTWRVLTHEMLLERVWGGVYGGEADSEHLRVHIRHLRQKLGDDPLRPRYVATERGIGYRFIGPAHNPTEPPCAAPDGSTSARTTSPAAR